MQSHKANFSQVFVLFMMSIGLMNHVMVIPMLLAISKRDSWISVLLSGGFILGWLLFIQFIMKKLDHTHLYSWLNNHFGKIIARGLCF